MVEAFKTFDKEYPPPFIFEVQGVCEPAPAHEVVAVQVKLPLAAIPIATPVAQSVGSAKRAVAVLAFVEVAMQVKVSPIPETTCPAPQAAG